MKYYTPLLFFALFALPACRQCEKTNHYYNRTATKIYLPHYNNGSFFVYQNASNAADIDTFYVRNWSDSMDLRYTESKCDGSYYETVKFALVSSVYHDSLMFFISSGPNADEVSVNGTYRQSPVFCNFETLNNNTITTSGEYGKDSTFILPNVTVLNTLYDNVLELDNKPFYVAQNTSVITFFAANIGMIQFNTYNLSNNVITGTYLLKSYTLQ